jgi:hypothetical protein
MQVAGLEEVITALLPPNPLGSSSAVQLPSDVAANNLLHLLQQHRESCAAVAVQVLAVEEESRAQQQQQQQQLQEAKGGDRPACRSSAGTRAAAA